MRALLSLLLIFTIFACTEQFGASIKKEQEKTEFTYVVHLMESESALNKAYDRHIGKKTGIKNKGFSGVDDEGRCHVFFLEPRGNGDRDRWETIGHETGHCIWGKFHPDGDSD